MALNPGLISFFISQLQNAKTTTLPGIVTQLFNHLKNEIKDNPIYEIYQKDAHNWKDWPDGNETGSFGGTWELPGDYEKAKSLVYSLYERFTQPAYDIASLMYELTAETRMDDGVIAFNQIFLDYFRKVLDDIIKANPEIESNSVSKIAGDRVFIIHGHDELLKKEIQLLLLRAGVNNIVLHEQADKGRTIIDKLIEESKSSNYAIALLSPDDLTNDGGKRARQNVILEIGYFVGLLGKERIRMLIKDNVTIPSDLQGILYEKYEMNGLWKMKILKELQAVGIFVDMQAVINTI